MKDHYPLATGEADRLRLEILNEMYNPTAQQFLLDNGLKEGMTVLEIGCGVGIQTCWLAQAVGPTGKVVALDINEDQVELSKQHAKSLGLDNIEFVCMDLNDLPSLNQQFDFIYGRWVVTFTQDPMKSFNVLKQALKPKGRLVYETCANAGHCYFCFPSHQGPYGWFKNSDIFFKHYALNANLGQELQSLFNQLDLKNVNIKSSHPIMTTPREKSVMRLAMLGRSVNSLEFMTQKEFDELVDQLSDFEQSDSIATFYCNVLACGVSPS